MLHNFGGNLEMYGWLDVVGASPIEALTSPNSTMVVSLKAHFSITKPFRVAHFWISSLEKRFCLTREQKDTTDNKNKQPQVELTHGANYGAHMGPATKLFMGYGAGCEETTWWAKAMRKIFGHLVWTYFLYKLSFTPCRSSKY